MCWSTRIGVGLLVLLASCVCRAEDEVNRPPIIKHEPVKVSVRNQSISIRAMVSDEEGEIKSVTLCYSTSKDAAPFKVGMQGAGAGTYLGVIPDGVLSGLKEVSYYIEAMDAAESISETPWYVVKLQSSVPSGQGAAMGPVAPGGEEKPSSWKKPAIVTGLIAAGIAAALVAANAGSSSDHDDDGDDPASGTAGTYTGTATRYLEIPGQPLIHSTYPITIGIADNGAVSSDNLHAGQHMEGLLLGSDFLLTAAATETSTNLTGQVRYVGTVANGRISGSIEGTGTTGDGQTGTYTGTFSATRP